jgi:hypothetical protein
MSINDINSRLDHNLKTYKALQIGNIDIYLCPKCGTNSARYASYKFNNGELEVPNIRDLTRSDYDVLKMGPFSVLNYKEERSDSIKVAIKRDPLERFISAFSWYNHKYGDIQKIIIKKSLDDTIISTPDDVHYLPQSAFYGDDISKYDHVIYPSELRNLILEITSVDLGPLHKGQTTLEYEVPTEEQIIMIKKLYQMDYENGYY